MSEDKMTRDRLSLLMLDQAEEIKQLRLKLETSHSLLSEATQEIERLRAELAEWKHRAIWGNM